MRKSLISGLLGIVLIAGCSGVGEGELPKRRSFYGVVREGMYEGLHYTVTFNSGTMVRVDGYGGEESKTPLRIYAYDKDNDGVFDSVTRENLDFDAEELSVILEEARSQLPK